MHCQRLRDPPCSPIDPCSVSARFVLSPPSPVLISAAVSPPGRKNTDKHAPCYVSLTWILVTKRNVKSSQQVVHHNQGRWCILRVDQRPSSWDESINWGVSDREVGLHLCFASDPRSAGLWWGAALWWTASTMASPSLRGSSGCFSGCSGLLDPESRHISPKANRRVNVGVCCNVHTELRRLSWWVNKVLISTI